MEALMKIAGQNELGVVEDNAQAIGAKFTYSDGTVKNAGTIGHIGTTSFFPSKNLGGYGDGGAIFTDDSELAIKMHSICNHGSKIRYYHDIVGVNSRLDTLQAAILEVKLAYLDDYIRGRQAAAARYDTLLSEIPGITTPFQAPFSTHVYHQYTLKVDRNREGLQQFLNKNGISSAIYYPVPLHLQKAYQHYGYHPGDFPVTEKVSELVLSLPIYPEIGSDTQEYIADKIKKFMLTN
jgi:dTDP-4-amino-4,6-dideoxygalactose transaminase